MSTMKAGTDTGSLVNHLYSRAVKGQPEPEVGMGATLLAWTDRYPATIVAVEGNIITVREDNSRRVDHNGMSETQDYEFTPNPDGYESNYRREKDGTWSLVVKNETTGRWNKRSGNGLRIGSRDKYHDFSF